MTKNKIRHTPDWLDSIARQHFKELNASFPDADKTLLVQCAEAYETYRFAQADLARYAKENATLTNGQQPSGQFKTYIASLQMYLTLRKQIEKSGPEAEPKTEAESAESDDLLGIA